MCIYLHKQYLPLSAISNNLVAPHFISYYKYLGKTKYLSLVIVSLEI